MAGTFFLSAPTVVRRAKAIGWEDDNDDIIRLHCIGRRSAVDIAAIPHIRQRHSNCFRAEIKHEQKTYEIGRAHV